jgi:RNA polymerase primary sigma factor
MAQGLKNVAEDTALSLYMRRARKVPLLTAEEEAALARLIQAGGAGSRAAEEQMILSNLRLVAAIAWKYVRPDMPLEDLIQEGNLGLMHAISKFDPEKGFRLYTYAHWWVHQSIRSYIQENGRLVRIPAHRAAQIAEMNKVVAQLSKSGIPSDVEVAEKMQVDVEFVRELVSYTSQPVSIHTPLFDGEGELGDTLVDETAVGAQQLVEEQDFKTKLRQALAKLKPRQIDVLTLRFGLGGDEPKTLEEVGAIYGVTRERIRQIESAALKELAKGNSGNLLRQFL